MAETWEHVLNLLRSGLEAAAGGVASRLERDVEVVQAKPPDSNSLLRFDVSFGTGGVLSWFISNEDATGFSDMIIGGQGDRGATLTELHLDALSNVFSDMLEAGVVGMNAQLSEAVDAGGVDMNMESRLPIVDSGGVQALLGMQIAGFGLLTIVQQADPALVEVLGQRMVSEAAPAAAPAAAEAPESEPANAVAPAAPAQDQVDGPAAEPPEAPAAAAAAAADGVPAAPANANVVEMPARPGGPAMAAPQGDRDLEMLLNVPLNVTVELGRAQRSVKHLLDMNVGSILELGKLAGDPMDILVNGKVLARGEVVVIDEEFGIRITEILTPEQRLRQIS